MKILMLVNWKVTYAAQPPADLQPPDYCVQNEPYWFFRYFPKNTQVDVVDIRSFAWLERFEKEKLRFYIWQTLRVLPRLNQYDIVLSHGMQSAIVLCIIRRLFGRGRYRHVVVDVGAFNSARESGKSLRLMQFAGKSLDGVIYHTQSQRVYYEHCHPWLLNRAWFIPFGTDAAFFSGEKREDGEEGKDSGAAQGRRPRAKNARSERPYIVCIGAAKRDWRTLLLAFHKLDEQIELRLIGIGKPEQTALERLTDGEPLSEKERAALSEACGDERICWIPRVPVLEMKRQIAGAAFCVLPLVSHNYSYGQMTMLQQMAMGKAVVAADVPSLAAYQRTDRTAAYQPGDAADLRRQLAALCRDILQENGRRCRRLGEAAARAVRELFNEERMAGEFLGCLECVMGEKTGEPSGETGRSSDADTGNQRDCAGL